MNFSSLAQESMLLHPHNNIYHLLKTFYMPGTSLSLLYMLFRFINRLIGCGEQTVSIQGLQGYKMASWQAVKPSCLGEQLGERLIPSVPLKKEEEPKPQMLLRLT